MIACLICPSDKPSVQLLAERVPFALVPLMGQTLLEYWLAHLAVAGFKSVLL
jgi:NDP-sugar pyrophosphorylase family protein